MLTLKDLKQLCVKKGYPTIGTSLIITKRIGCHMREGMEVEFHGLNGFYSASGEQKMSWEMGFGTCGGARSWNDFTARGRRWIQENFDPERCSLIVNVPLIGIEGLKASQVRMK